MFVINVSLNQPSDKQSASNNCVNDGDCFFPIFVFKLQTNISNLGAWNYSLAKFWTNSKSWPQPAFNYFCLCLRLPPQRGRESSVSFPKSSNHTALHSDRIERSLTQATNVKELKRGAPKERERMKNEKRHTDKDKRDGCRWNRLERKKRIRYLCRATLMPHSQWITS